MLLTGDLALLHDASGLIAADRLGERLLVVVIDNGGGGIFSFLPIAQFGDAVGFDEHFLTPSGVDLEALCHAAGLRCETVTGWEHFATACKEGLAREGVSVVRVPVDRERSVARFRALVDVAARAWKGT